MKKSQSVSKRSFIWIMLFMLTTAGTVNVKADEGMWIPMLLNKYNIEAMQEAGLRLSAEDIYSINHLWYQRKCSRLS